MKLRTIIAAFAASVAVAAPAAAEEQVYYCTSELGTGIAKDGANGQWKTYGFPDIRFTMKLGDNTRGETTSSHNRDLVLTRDGSETHFICLDYGSDYRCVSVLSRRSIQDFFADDPDPDKIIAFTSETLITNLTRFELYRGAMWRGFVADSSGERSAIHAGTCETF